MVTWATGTILTFHIPEFTLVSTVNNISNMTCINSKDFRKGDMVTWATCTIF
jgi:hypothetical protein